jgi:hypothetical protein
MPIRFVIEHEAVLTRTVWNGWSLCLQWGALTDENGKVDQRGYRNIWRDPTNRLFTGRAQARLPSRAISDELWAIAEAEGWANLVDQEIYKDPGFGPVTLVWSTGRPLGCLDRGEDVPSTEVKEFPTNEAAIKYTCERIGRSKDNLKASHSQSFTDPFIMAGGEIVWNRVELLREHQRRNKSLNK